ncbi:MAG: diaminopropionate ammonia-lyase [Clostridia bacterium]|nr:diaminopropionate ammonia-lyase [Clostridia bacterium]
MENLKILHHPADRHSLPEGFDGQDFSRVLAFHKSMPGYCPTPLVSLENLAKVIGVKGIYVKDESKRFGLNAFKALGASYAVHELLEAQPDIEEIVTATDGNHGRGVAWAASSAGKRATVFLPRGTVEIRRKNIADIDGARAEITDLTYDDAVRHAADYARRHNAALVQDTAFEGYRDVPRNIVLGYSTMASEAADSLDAQSIAPTHVFLQAGVGSMAGGITAYLAHRYGRNIPIIAVMEAMNTPCVYESIEKGCPAAACYSDYTAMAGLNCGEPNPDTLPILRNFATFFIQCPDEVTFEGMRRLCHPIPGDSRVISGESGAVGLGVLMRLMLDASLEEWKTRMGLDENSVVLLFSTEGDTDPDNYRRITGCEAL